jgi:hypothetical protein
LAAQPQPHLAGTQPGDEPVGLAFGGNPLDQLLTTQLTLGRATGGDVVFVWQPCPIAASLDM